MSAPDQLRGPVPPYAFLGCGRIRCGDTTSGHRVRSDCRAEFVFRYDPDAVEKLGRRPRPIERVLAGANWLIVGVEYVCPACFQRHYVQPSLASQQLRSDAVHAAIARSELRQIAVVEEDRAGA